MALSFKEVTYSLDIPSRLDRWIHREYPGVTQGIVEKAIRKNFICVNSQKSLAKTNLKAGDKISIEIHLFDEFIRLAKENIEKPQFETGELPDFRSLILDETSDFLVFNKPSGLNVQGGKNVLVSVDGWLRSISDQYRLVHRIDRDTSGLLIVAKNLSAAVFLTQLFRERKIKKVYRAIVLGKLDPPSGMINAPLNSVGEESARMCVDERNGQAAETSYNTLRYCEDENWSEVDLYPTTGRKHQLRVHMAYLHAPILGDKKYDSGRETFYLLKRPVKGTLFLHASRMSFLDKKKKKCEWIAPLPAYWP